ncbi:MAG: CoA transferase [Desulfobacteria bacterium]|jgi:crotonobetainyl-CoA:carnitine CoA-transferase CaiB-like acyl-CoA transferase
MKKALEGVKVLDLTQFEAGTTCTILLAFLGADVIKVENPATGDMGRFAFSEKRAEGIDSFYFILLNLNKKSVTLNLKAEKGKEMFKEMVKKSDIVVNNFTVGTMDSLGLGYDVLKELNPKIINASITGYGTYGPYRDYPCFDIVAQATGGLMGVTGYPENPPTKVGTGLGDSIGAINLAVGILGALYQREKTGEGQEVEVAMQDSIFNTLRPVYNFYYVGGSKPIERTGNKTKMIAPWNSYKTSDGYVVIGLLTNPLWENLLKAIGREDALPDPRFADPLIRGTNCDVVDSMIEEWTSKKSKMEAMSYLAGKGVPCGAILDMTELLDNPHLRERGMVTEIEHPTRGKIAILGSPIKLSKSETKIQPAPLLGQHNEEIYASMLNFTKEDLAKLKEEKVI